MKKILIADDALSTRLRLKKYSEVFGYKPIVVSNGKEAWDCWQSERPEIVITDWYMPVMGGRQLCQKIRESEGEKHTFIIIVTIIDKPQKVKEGLEAGADDFLAKPFNKNDMRISLLEGEKAIPGIR